MFDFKNQDVSQRTHRVELPELGPGAFVEVRHAGDTNPAYHNSLLKHSTKHAKRIKTRGGELDPAQAKQMIADQRDMDRRLFPECIMVGWSGIKDENGVEAVFDRQTAHEFVNALCKQAQFLFDRIRNEAGNPSNFMAWDEIVPDEEELEGLAGNSENG